MESELEKFRRRKHLEQKKEEIKSKVKSTANSWARTFYEALLPNWNEEGDDEGEEIIEEGDSQSQRTQKQKSVPRRKGDDKDSHLLSQEEQNIISDNDGNVNNKWLMYLVKLFRFLAWTLIYIGFLKIGFGAVFFTISLLVFIYWNTRKSSGRKKKKGEVSAYSVFNRDCQAIDGTLKAEHLEKQLLYRSS